MKKALALVLTLNLLATPMAVWAQQPAPPPPTGSQPLTLDTPKLSQADLEKLVGPIALYPDPIVGMILPASTVPTDIVLAARFLRENKDPSQIDAQNWDPSVKGLAHYPDVINMMNENLDWTNQLGAAVIAQQADVMTAIQSQRAKAQTLGNLQTTAQQTVTTEQSIIQIQPADPQIIYVPTYNPAVVYVQPAPPLAPLITFGAGFAMGIWLSNGCNWHNNNIYVNNWSGGWHGYNNNVNINNTNININNNNVWHANNNRPPPRAPYNPNRPGGNPGSMPGFKPAPPGGWNGNRPTTPNNPNRPGNGGNGGWNGGNKPGGGNLPNTRPGAGGGGIQNGGNRPSTLPASGGTQNKPFNNLKPAGSGSQNSKQFTPNSQRPGADTPDRKVPGINGGNTSAGHGASKPGERPAAGNFQRPAGGGAAQRPAGGGAAQRPAGGGAAQRPAGGGGAQRPAGGGGNAGGGGLKRG